MGGGGRGYSHVPYSTSAHLCTCSKVINSWYQTNRIGLVQLPICNPQNFFIQLLFQIGQYLVRRWNPDFSNPRFFEPNLIFLGLDFSLRHLRFFDQPIFRTNFLFPRRLVTSGFRYITIGQLSPNI